MVRTERARAAEAEVHKKNKTTLYRVVYFISRTAAVAAAAAE